MLAKPHRDQQPPRRVYSVSSSDSDDTEPTPTRRVVASTGWITSQRLINYNRQQQSTAQASSSVIVGTHTIHTTSPASPPAEIVPQHDVNSYNFLFCFVFFL